MLLTKIVKNFVWYVKSVSANKILEIVQHINTRVIKVGMVKKKLF